MPNIVINEIDNSLYGLTGVDNNHIVYAPINSKAGTYEPTLIGSVDDMTKEFGDSAVADDISWLYVRDILIAGFPVLVKRIEYADVVGSDGGKASGTVGTAITVNSKTHGTYANSLTVTFNSYCSGGTAITNVKTMSVKVKKGTSSLETFILYVNESSVSSAQIVEDLGAQIAAIESRYFAFTVTQANLAALITSSISTTQTITPTGGLDIVDNGSTIDIADSIVKAYAGLLGADADAKAANKIKYLYFLNDKYIYDVKFITLGGYASATNNSVSADETAAFQSMISLCESRQDCIAIPDLPYGTGPDDVKSHFSPLDTTYAGAYAPWMYMKLFSGEKQWMPPSYAFLTQLAISAKTNFIWSPPAGSSRMTLTKAIKAEYEIGSAIKDSWQTNDGQSVNPIMRIRGGGYTVYGQRTLVGTVSPMLQTSLKSMTVRLVSVEIKKVVFDVCAALTFEQNMSRTWNEFKAGVEPTLLNMKKNGGLNDYQIVMDTSTISTTDIANNIARGYIKVSVNDAIEDFIIGFEIYPGSVSFSDDVTLA